MNKRVKKKRQNAIIKFLRKELDRKDKYIKELIGSVENQEACILAMRNESLVNSMFSE